MGQNQEQQGPFQGNVSGNILYEYTHSQGGPASLILYRRTLTSNKVTLLSDSDLLSLSYLYLIIPLYVQSLKEGGS